MSDRTAPTASEPTSPSPFDTFTCVELVEPDAEDFTRLPDHIELHELAVEDAIHAHQRPKLERYGDSLFLVVKSAHYDDAAERVAFGEIQMLFGEDFLVIVRHDPALRLDLESNRGPTGDDGPGPDVIVHRIVDQVVDGYAPVLAGFEIDVREVEETVFDPDDVYPTERIYRLKRQLLAFLHNTRTLIQPLTALIDERPDDGTDDLVRYFRDVEDHLRRVVNRTERASELASEMLDANMAQVSLHQNADMRKMSAWAAIFLLPTVLAGIWGMNFETMPELEWVYGYPVALGIMIIGTVVLYWRFRRSGWL